MALDKPVWVDSTMNATSDLVRVNFPPVEVPHRADHISVHVPDIPVGCVVQAWVSDNPRRMIGIPPYSLDSNLAAYWILDPFYASTTTFLDLVSGQVMATVGSPSASESPMDGSGIALSGTAQYLQAAALTAGEITTGDFSVMVLFKQASTTDAAILASKRLGAAGDGVGWEVGLTADNYPTITLEDADSTTSYTSGTAALDDGKIHMVHHTVDRDSATGYLTYIDGALDGTNGDPRGEQLTLAAATKYLRLGANSHGTPAALLTGSIYAVAIWNDVRTATEVAADWRGGFAAIAAAAGTVLPVCANGSDPVLFDLTEFASAARGRYIQLRCATLQTAASGPLTARWYFS